MAAEDSVRPLNNFTAPGMMSVPIRTNGVEGGAQSWKSGAPIGVAFGLFAELADDFTSGAVGFASQDASTVAATPVSYIPCVPGIEFEATLEDQANGDHPLSQANLYAKYALRQVVATGAWYLDENDTGNAAAVVVALVDPIGTVQGRVRARLLDTVTVFND